VERDVDGGFRGIVPGGDRVDIPEYVLEPERVGVFRQVDFRQERRRRRVALAEIGGIEASPYPVIPSCSTSTIMTAVVLRENVATVKTCFSSSV
jgi:hypothetical protein